MEDALKPEIALTGPDTVSNELLPEYHFDYSKARSNRFAARLNQARLAEECTKLDVREEQAMADEGLAADTAEWPLCE